MENRPNGSRYLMLMILDANDGSVGSEYVEKNKGEGEHDSKSNKGKRKHWDGETSSNGSSRDQIVSGGAKKRKRKEPSVRAGNKARGS